MPKITLYSDKHTTTTSVSNIFIDEYMSDANGEFVKIYLYLLRRLHSSDGGFSISEIADKFEHTEKDIKRALCYWERMQLLHLDYDTDENLVGIRLLDALSKRAKNDSHDSSQAPSTAAASSPTETAAPDTSAKKQPEKKSYSADDIRRFTKQEAVTELLFIAEQYLGRTLNATDLNAILYWHDELKLPLEVIEYLIEYCVSNRHTSIRYIEKVALSWAKNRYQTVEEAKLANGQFNQTYSAIMKAMGITGRSLVPAETAYIDKWKTEFGFPAELIRKACEKTIQAAHEPSFEYADRILSNWKANNVATLEDVAKLDAAHQKRKKAPAAALAAVSKNKFNNFDQRTYDYDQLEKILLTTSAQS